MKVGDYVRYKKLIYHNQGVDDIRISRIKDIEDAIETGYNQKFIFFENGNGEYEDRIIKSSPNIIDLIQRGDFINGDQISVVEVSDIDGIKRAFNCEYESACYTNEMIKSVVTKEQFEKISYKVGDNNE